MIYKIEPNSCQFIEVEAITSDEQILVHIADGYEDGANIKYENFMNLELSKIKCEELIKALQYALDDYNEKATH